jgi:uncharacterized membrane protein
MKCDILIAIMTITAAMVGLTVYILTGNSIGAFFAGACTVCLCVYFFALVTMFPFSGNLTAQKKQPLPEQSETDVH